MSRIRGAVTLTYLGLWAERVTRAFWPLWSLALASGVAKEGLCGLELVEVSPPYDPSDITALMGVRVCVEALGSMCAHGTMGKHKSIIDKPVAF